jgi:hypothetical protein
LGDALDFWKGALIDMLRDHLRNVHVLPMFTDKNAAEVWTEGRLGTYAHLLRVDRNGILRCCTRFQTSNRARYFESLNIPADDDLFVDPDIGIEPEGKGSARHVLLSELAVLLPPDTKRVVLIYQHRLHKKNWVEACLRRVVQSSHLTGCHAFAYGAGSVAMLFVSRDSQRLALLHSTLTDLTASLPTDMRRVTPILPHHPDINGR